MAQVRFLNRNRPNWLWAFSSVVLLLPLMLGQSSAGGCGATVTVPSPNPGPNGNLNETLLDSDGDGVLEAADTCPDTPEGELPNDQGCSCSQIAPCDDDDMCTIDACKAGACIFTPVLCEGGECVDGTCNCVDCSVEYPYVVIGNDGHSFYLDGEYINGAGFGTDLTGTLTLEPGEHTLEVLLYNSGGGGAILFGHKENGIWKVPSEYPRIALRADDGTANAWSVYRALDRGYHSPSSFIPHLGDWETTFWMTVPERGAGVWNTNDATNDHWIIWDDYGSTVVFPQSYWVCRTTVIVSER